MRLRARGAALGIVLLASVTGCSSSDHPVAASSGPPQCASAASPSPGIAGPEGLPLPAGAYVTSSKPSPESGGVVYDVVVPGDIDALGQFIDTTWKGQGITGNGEREEDDMEMRFTSARVQGALSATKSPCASEGLKVQIIITQPTASS